MYFTISSQADIDAFFTTLGTDLTTAGWTVSSISDATYKGILAESSGSSLYDFGMGVVFYTHKYEDWNFIVCQSGATFDGTSNLPDTHISDTAHLVFTLDNTALTFTNVLGYLHADSNSIALVMGNTTEGVYNAMFYGRLTTPSGDPTTALNPTAVDVTAIALGSTSFAKDNNNQDGKLQIYQDLGGRYWQYYNVHDAPVANILHGLVGGMDASLINIKFGQWQPYFKDLFLRDVRMRNDAHVMLIANDRDGLRGYIPSLFTISPTPSTVKSHANILLNKDNLLVSGTGTASSTATNLYDSANTLTGVAVGDVVYHRAARKFVKVTTAGSHLVTETVSPYTWLAAEYDIYSDIAFSIFQVGFDVGETVEDASYIDTLAVATDVHSTYTAAATMYIFGDDIDDELLTIVSSSYTSPNTTMSVQEDLEDPVGSYVILSTSTYALTEVVNGSAGSGALILEGAAGVATALAEDVSIELLMSSGSNGTYTMSLDSTRATGTRVPVTTVANGTADGYAALSTNVQAITVVTTGGAGSASFGIAGDAAVAALYTAGLTFKVYGSTANDATYTVKAGGATETGGTVTIPVDEAVSDATVDGDIVLTTDLVAISLANTRADEFVLTGNVASSYPISTGFQVFGSTGNDGTYTSDAAGAYSSTGWIYAWVDEVLAASTTPGRICLTANIHEIVDADVDNYGTQIDLSVNNFTNWMNRNHPMMRRRAIVLAE